jgi:hypothetical protein
MKTNGSLFTFSQHRYRIQAQHCSCNTHLPVKALRLATKPPSFAEAEPLKQIWHGAGDSKLLHNLVRHLRPGFLVPPHNLLEHLVQQKGSSSNSNRTCLLQQHPPPSTVMPRPIMLLELYSTSTEESNCSTENVLKHTVKALWPVQERSQLLWLHYCAPL